MMLFGEGLTGLVNNYGPTGGIIGGVVLIVLTLIKARPVERQNLSQETSQHLDRLTRERDEAAERAERAEIARDTERELRRVAEDASAAALRHSSGLEEQIAGLKEQVERLTEQVAELTAKTNAKTEAAEPAT